MCRGTRGDMPPSPATCPHSADHAASAVVRRDGGTERDPARFGRCAGHPTRPVQVSRAPASCRLLLPLCLGCGQLAACCTANCAKPRHPHAGSLHPPSGWAAGWRRTCKTCGSTCRPPTARLWHSWKRAPACAARLKQRAATRASRWAALGVPAGSTFTNAWSVVVESVCWTSTTTPQGGVLHVTYWWSATRNHKEECYT